MKPIPLSVVILTKNEEKNILDCLESLNEVSEVIIIDDESSDRTLEVIRSLNFRNVKIFRRKLEDDFSKQRNYGLEKVKNEWVLYLDADERVSPELLKEISGTILLSDKSGFYVRRRDVMWGRELKFGETGNIRLLRLGKKSAGKWKGQVHETWGIRGLTDNLKSEIKHYPHQTMREFISEISFYSTLRAKELVNKGVKVSFIDIVMYPKAKFIVNYLLKLGFLDGTPGFIFALMMSFHSFLVRSKVWLSGQK